MSNTAAQNGETHRLSDGGVDLHEMVEDIHVGFANFSDLQMHFDDWESAAKFYATATSQRFPVNKEETTCELCCVSKDTKSHQLLFRVFLDKEWGKKVVKGLWMLPMLLLALASPIIFIPGNSRRSGVRLVFPTFHNLCRPCGRGLKFRFFLATSLGLVITLIKFVLLVASIMGIIGIISIVIMIVFDKGLTWTRGVLAFLICVSPMIILALIHHCWRGLEKYIRFPEKLRRIPTKPFLFIPIKDSQIQEPIILDD
jgi:hypothetical protein